MSDHQATDREDFETPPRYLNMWKAGVSEIPESVWDLHDLETLILADNSLTHVSARIRELSRLKTLDLGHNQLRNVPPELGELTQLSDFLYLHDNRLASLPPSMGRL